MLLRRASCTSNGSRNILKITSNWLLRDRYNKLTWRKYSKGGRGAFGRIIIRTKGALKRRLRFPKINYSFRFTWLSFVSTFYLIPFQNKLVSLCFISTGGVVYLQSTVQFKLFSFITFPYLLRGVKQVSFKPTLYILMRVKLFSRVSLVELYPGSGVQYVRSSGTSARFVKVNWDKHSAVLQMPSGVRKAVSLYSLASVGAVSLRLKRLVKNTKSGVWRNFGCKSQVRGVAMNPVDHPHGGRTKTIKHPRTPWGKTTKKK